MNRATEKAPVREHQGQGDRERGNAPSHIEISNNLGDEDLSMKTSIAEISLESVAEMPLRDLQLQEWQTAIRDHLTASPLTFAQIAVRAEIPPTVLTRKLAQTECVFTIREIRNLSHAIGTDPDKIIRPPVHRDTLNANEGLG